MIVNGALIMWMTKSHVTRCSEFYCLSRATHRLSSLSHTSPIHVASKSPQTRTDIVHLSITALIEITKQISPSSLNPRPALYG
ncbi:hypothetical protein P154DRAFT_366536 [Amniculicola lignicola CBS 123094]|uniref:Uncharacterized protein n=1 Tax=Amniculicola lignicola CBS 123094 TaxID=1392246 RepID=A0A6A5W117_9PLEO|nr:hypothetical protein P154DRAFT_366536 [Amniculicola lignicola CBS 123094]